MSQVEIDSLSLTLLNISEAGFVSQIGLRWMHCISRTSILFLIVQARHFMRKLGGSIPSLRRMSKYHIYHYYVPVSFIVDKDSLDVLCILSTTYFESLDKLLKIP